MSTKLITQDGYDALKQELDYLWRIEFGLLGAVSGLLAALGCELVSLVLYRFAFDLPWHPHPWLLLLPLVGALLVGGAGVFGTRRALNASPLNVLREG